VSACRIWSSEKGGEAVQAGKIDKVKRRRRMMVRGDSLLFIGSLEKRML
jgi:hypothetical protein